MGFTATVFLLVLISSIASGLAASDPHSYRFPFFNDTDRQLLELFNANIEFGALQITPDTSDTRFSLVNQSGRIFLNQGFKLWKKSSQGTVVASFNSSFVLNIVNKSGNGGDGLAFIVTNEKNDFPENSYGQYLGLFNSTTNGDSNNRLVAVEFDTRKSNANDPDDNHVGIDVNRIESIENASVSPRNITLLSQSDIATLVQYDGGSKLLSVYINNGDIANPSNPLLSVKLDLSMLLEDEIYFGFSASTGVETELNCIRSWNLTVQYLGSGNNKGIVIGLAVGLPGIIVIVVSVIGGVLWRRGHENRKSVRVLDRALTNSTGGPRKFRLREVRRATRNFDGKSLLGQGGFGAVYRGVLSNKTPVAVKRVSENSNQGEQEFMAEVKIISRLRHKNLVRLLGWCHEYGELLLIYDLMPNGSLDKLIFEEDDKHEVLDWHHRCKIVCGVASALLYLHEECEQQVIHRDLKASNIMLDSDYNARLGDFGLARLIEHNKNSYTTTAIAGTPGYIAPEYFHTGRSTTESDVFSFGAVALEVACGRRPRTESHVYLVDWVWGLYREGRLLDAADPRLNEFDKDEMICMLLVGLSCSHPNPQERPTIRQVLQILTKDAPPPLMPFFKPAFVWPAPGMTDNQSSSSDFSTQ